MLITARENLCCPLLKLALSVSSQPNITLTREMSGGRTNFPVWFNYSSSQPPDFFLPLSNIVKIYYGTCLDLTIIIIIISFLIQKFKHYLGLLCGKFEASNCFFWGNLKDTNKMNWLSSLEIKTVARECINRGSALTMNQKFYVEKTSNFGCLPWLQYL